MDTTTDHFTPLALRVRGNNTILMMVLEAVIRDVASGIDSHPDRTEIDFRLQIQGN